MMKKETALSIICAIGFMALILGLLPNLIITIIIAFLNVTIVAILLFSNTTNRGGKKHD